MGEPKLRLQGVSQVYEGARGETRALQNMDIDVAPGDLFDAKPCKQSAAGYIIQIDTV